MSDEHEKALPLKEKHQKNRGVHTILCGHASHKDQTNMFRKMRITTTTTTIAIQPGQSPTTRGTARHRSHDGFWEIWTRCDLCSVLACPFSHNVSELGFRHMICNSTRSDMKLASACQQPWPFHWLSWLRQSAVDWARRRCGSPTTESGSSVVLCLRLSNALNFSTATC